MKTQTATPPPLPVVTSDWLLALDPRQAPLATTRGGRLPGWRNPSTPARLRAAIAGICLGALAWWLASVGAVRGTRAGLREIGHVTAPSIVAAGHLRATLAGQDANLVNSLLAGANPEARRRAAEAVTERRHETAENLVRSAESITLGELERVPLTTLAENIPAHESTLVRAQVAADRGDLPAALAAEREAADGLRLFLLPAAGLLEYNNSVALDRAYGEAHKGWLRGTAAVLGLGGALSIGLVILQLWLARQTRRVFNPALLGATLLTVTLTFWTSIALLRAEGQLRAGTTDSFASVRFLWQTRSLAYGMNAEQSRWLFDRDPGRAAAAERAFLDYAARIAWRPPDSRHPAEELVKTLGAEMTRVGVPLPYVPGSLERELANGSDPAKADAAREAIKLFGRYFEVDRKVRALESTGRHPEAVALCLSQSPGGANGAFLKLDAALGDLLEINGRQFDAAIARGSGALGGLDPLNTAAALVVAGLGVAGLWPRLREYAS